MIEIKKQLAHETKNLLDGLSSAHGLTEEAVYSMLEYPPERSMGDVSFPCFGLAKALRMAPVKIAETLAAGYKNENIDHVENKNGYLNFHLKNSCFSSVVLDKILKLGEKYGSSQEGEGKTVILDYSSPNVAKPFHIGHLGTTVIGHSLKMIYSFLGYTCIGINHLGDWGTQFGKLIVAYRKWGKPEDITDGGIDALVALYVRFHKEEEADPSLSDTARAEFLKLEQGNAENLDLWKKFIDISIKEYEKTYSQLGIEFDYYTGESFYTDKMQAQIDVLKDKELLKLDDGASIVDLEEYKMPPCLILKKDGSTLYPTRDIAAAVYRMNEFHFDKCIYVTSSGQSLHFAQWFRVMAMMGYDWYGRLVHVPYGTVSINGSKLATRTGNVILLRDLFAAAIRQARQIIEEKNPSLPDKDKVAEQVGVGAIVFHYLYNSRIKDINFILEDALSFEGNTGPYAQYTYVRTCSILERAGEVTGECAEAGSREAALIKVLALFPEKVLSAAKDYEPSVITRYIIDVCMEFNRFYQECPVLTSEGQVRNLRIKTVLATQYVLGNALRLICLQKPKKI